MTLKYQKEGLLTDHDAASILSSVVGTAGFSGVETRQGNLGFEKSQKELLWRKRFWFFSRFQQILDSLPPHWIILPTRKFPVVTVLCWWRIRLKQREPLICDAAMQQPSFSAVTGRSWAKHCMTMSLSMKTPMIINSTACYCRMITFIHGKRFMNPMQCHFPDIKWQNRTMLRCQYTAKRKQGSTWNVRPCCIALNEKHCLSRIPANFAKWNELNVTQSVRLITAERAQEHQLVKMKISAIFRQPALLKKNLQNKVYVTWTQ